VSKRILYAATIFWSALLLLLVQPMLTKAILPWFGGSAGVWTTSMLFYQTVLLLRVCEDLPAEEVALRMNRTAGAVRMLQMRALTALREQLSSDDKVTR